MAPDLFQFLFIQLKFFTLFCQNIIHFIQILKCICIEFHKVLQHISFNSLYIYSFFSSLILHFCVLSNFIYFFDYLFFFIVVQVQLSPFYLHHPPFPPSILLPLFGFVQVSFIYVPENPSGTITLYSILIFLRCQIDFSIFGFYFVAL